MILIKGLKNMKSIKINGNYEGHLQIKKPSELEVLGLVVTMRKLVTRYTQAKGYKTKMVIRNNEMSYARNNVKTVELDEPLEAGFLKTNQVIESVFVNSNNKVICKAFDRTNEKDLYFEVKMDV